MTVPGVEVVPAFRSVPPYHRTLGPLVADVAGAAGYGPDLEQRALLDVIFGLRPDNRVTAFEVAIIVARQNVKTSTLKMCTLGWLFVADQRLIVWSAHEFATATEAHRDLAELIENTPTLRRRLKPNGVRFGSADKSIELASGARVVFKARTATGGRGLSGDKVVLDEAFALQPAHLGALMPTLSARPDPQLVYASSAGQEQSGVLRAIRDRGRAGTDPSLAYVEWTDDLGGDCALPACDHAVGRAGCRLDDEARWVRANPTLGRRITFDYVRAERRGMPPEEFARERLGWWDESDSLDGGAFPVEAWEACRTTELALGAPLSFAVEVAEDRSWSCVAAAGKGVGGLHVEVGEYAEGVSWVLDRVVELTRRNRRSRVVVQRSSAAGSLLPGMRDRGVVVLEATSADYAAACGGLHDLVTAGGLRHSGQPELDVAVRHARTKPAGDGAWVWNRRTASVDISPLVAVTLAAWGAEQKPRPGRFVSF